MENNHEPKQDKMKDLVSRLKQTTANPSGVKANIIEQDLSLENNIENPKGKEVEKEEPKQKKTRKKKQAITIDKDGDIIQQIRSIEIDDSTAASMHIRFPVQIHSKLLALKMKKVSAQKFTIFALMRLMEEPEIKDTIKQILNDLE